MHYRTAGKILVVDDEPANVEVFSRLMKRLGYEVVTASNGELALQSVTRDRPDLVLLDVNMPGIDGFEVCRRLKADPKTRLIPVVLITALTASEDRVRGIQAGADDFLEKPPVVVELEARVRSLTRLKRYTDELDSAESVILSLGLTIEARDPYTQGHCQRLAKYATALGKRLGLDEDQLVALNRGAFLHDVGKIGIPDAVLLKADRLTASEYAVIQQHTVIGDTLCSQLRLLEDVRPIVRHHHERPDGTGYPDQLKGEDIPLLARILSVVDVYDALTTERPYKPALSPDHASRELRTEAARGWKFGNLVEEFLSMLPHEATTVLVVDDEAPIRQIARRILEEDGYRVTEAGNGLEAIDLLAQGIPLDLLMADLEMPELGGDEMVRRIRATRPDLKVLYVTGHIDTLMDARSLGEGEAFLDKPFSAASLREAVSMLLRGTIKHD